MRGPAPAPEQDAAGEHQEQDRPLRADLPGRRHLQEAQQRAGQRERQRADHGADGRDDAAGEAAAAEDHRADAEQRVGRRDIGLAGGGERRSGSGRPGRRCGAGGGIDGARGSPAPTSPPARRRGDWRRPRARTAPERGARDDEVADERRDERDQYGQRHAGGFQLMNARQPARRRRRAPASASRPRRAR